MDTRRGEQSSFSVCYSSECDIEGNVTLSNGIVSGLQPCLYNLNLILLLTCKTDNLAVHVFSTPLLCRKSDVVRQY